MRDMEAGDVSRMLTYAHVCSRMLTQVGDMEASALIGAKGMLTCADVC